MKRAAPAKINLSLIVREKRADGFHEIETLMTPISLADELTITVSENGGDVGDANDERASAIRFACSDASIPGDETNLVVRAARLFLAETKIPTALKIHLEKKIPHGAGLGGGSSDAASALLALDAIFETKLARSRLAEMAAQLGSDVPFFICETAAICRGRGEIVDPVALSQRLPLLLLKPEFGVPTPWAYQHWQRARELPGIPYAAQNFPWGNLTNDLERPVFEKYLFLAMLKQWLLDQPETAGALMSGSGSTCFAVLHDLANGEVLAKRAREEMASDLWTCVCETV